MSKRNHRGSGLKLLFAAALLTAGFLSYGCGSGVRLMQCTGNCISVGGWISFSENVGSISAYSFYETREVDPNVYAHDSSSTPTGTITVTLGSGATVTYSGNLYLDTSTTVTPTTSGHTVLVYRPVDPSGLQSFIDQYKSQATSVDVNTTVKLVDVSGGSASSSVVDLKGNYDSSLNYLGSVNSTPPSYEPFNQDV